MFARLARRERLEAGPPGVVAGAAAATVASGLGIGAGLLPPVALLGLLLSCVAFIVAHRVVGLDGARGIAGALSALGTFIVSWNAFRAPGGAACDVLFLLSVPFIGLAAAHGCARFAVPGWLVASAVCIGSAAALSALLAPVFAPARIYSPTDFVASRLGGDFGAETNLSGIVKLEIALLAFPVLLGAIARGRERTFAAIWVVGTAVCGLVALLDATGRTHVGASVSGITWLGGRQAGFTAQPNALAAACTMAIPVAIVGVLRSSSRWPSIGVLLVLVGATVVTGSRVGLVAVFVAICASGLLVGTLRRRLPLILVAGTTLVAVGLGVFAAYGDSLVVAQRFTGADLTAQQSDSLRQQIRDQVLQAITERPIAGSGFAVIRDAHNIWLQILHAGGVIGLAGFIVFAVGTVRLGGRLRLPDVANRDLAGALSAATLTWLVAGVLQNQISDRYLYVPLGLLLAFLPSRHRTRPLA